MLIGGPFLSSFFASFFPFFFAILLTCFFCALVNLCWAAPVAPGPGPAKAVPADQGQSAGSWLDAGYSRPVIRSQAWRSLRSSSPSSGSAGSARISAGFSLGSGS